MKMIVAIMDISKSSIVSKVLLASNFRVTRMASTQGFLREGSATLMLGVEDNMVETALEVIRSQFPASSEKTEANMYVLNVKDFETV
jgi:uncharacterized protein YaaQ